MEFNSNHNLRAWVKSRGLAGEALLIAGFTGASYLATYTYQIAYLWYFKVPLDFLEIKTTGVLMAGLVGLIWVIANIMFVGYFVGKDLSPSKKVHIFASVSLFQILFPILIIALNPIHPWISISGIVVIVGLYIYLIQDLKKDTSNKRNGVDVMLDKLEENYGTFFVICIFLGFFFVFYGASFGLIVAKLKSNFPVPSTQPDVAIVSTQGTNFVGVVFDQVSKKLTTKIKLITPDQISTSTIFEIEKLSPTYNYFR